ncbi:MAG: long-chain fatty acid--CoA ligase [Desulfobacteraceae bacterium]|nr:long-chain fatty acid--CoA ligase [Desulfobacteraceae bacterium]
MVGKTFPEFSTNYPLLLTALMKRPVRVYPNEIGVVYRNYKTGIYQRFTWMEWYKRTCRLAHALEKMGVKPGKAGEPGDRVGTMALNTHRHLELYYAVPCIGATLHAINIRLALDHIVYTITHAGDKVLFVDDDFMPLLENIYDRIKDTVEVFVYMSDKPGLPDTKIKNIYEYETLIQNEPDTFDWPYLHEDTIATLCYTTATTGLPKGAMFSHRALYLMVIHLMAAGAALNNDPKAVFLGENAIPLMTTPMFHAHAWGAPFTCVFSANKIVFPGTFTVEGFCDLVHTEKVTSVAVVPTILAMIVEYPNLHKYDLSSLQAVGVGGGALPLGLKQKVEKVIPGIRAGSGYGMTETAPTTVTAFIKKTMRDWPDEEINKVLVKTGLSVPGLEVEVVDEQGKPIAHDGQAMGEIVIRGPWVMEKYYKNPEKTSEVWVDGWFHTGDVATIDDQDFIVIADRKSDVIRSGSEMVPTVLLENIAAGAHFVLNATIVGVPDEVWGQKALAIIKLVPGATENEMDFINYLKAEGVEKGKITKWMLPKLVAIVEEIPMTSVGKYSKMEIRKNLDKFLALAKTV